MIVERPDRCDESAVGRVLGDRVGEALGGAQVRAIQYQQRRVVPVDAERRCGGRPRGRQRSGGRTRLASCKANCRPMQARCPVPKGL
jgi:hypothetical protein